jgi:hypothetical protein
MTGQVVNRIVDLITKDVLDELGHDGMLGADADSVDCMIQRGLDSIETAVYDKVLERINEVLSTERNATIDKWW